MRALRIIGWIILTAFAAGLIAACAVVILLILAIYSIFPDRTEMIAAPHRIRRFQFASPLL
jgi:hypothetical protein